MLTKANYLQDAGFLSFLYKAVPGSWVAVAGEKGALGRVLAVVQNGSSVRVSFSFIREPVPTARLYPMQIDRLRVRNLVPGCTATPGNGVVSAEIDVDGILADGEQGVLGVRADPLSITYRCQGDMPQHGHLEIPCGRTTAVEVDVAKPDGLAEVAANLFLVGTSGTHGYRRFGTVNLKRAGRRVFTIGGSVTGLQPGDTNNLADLPNGWLDSLYVEYNWPGPRNPAQRAIYAIRVKVWNPLIA